MPNNKPHTVRKTYVGTIIGPAIPISQTRPRPNSPYKIKWDNDDPEDSDFPPMIPSLRQYDLQRLNEKELKEEFEENLQAELGLVKKLAVSGNLRERAATLASLRNLTRYLSEEIKENYQKAEELAREVDLTGKAAVLFTLRNLNKYLEDRKL